jgi:hypothetical protein
MEPNYHQLEFDTRLYLTHLDLFGDLYWCVWAEKHRNDNLAKQLINTTIHSMRK